MGKIEKQSILTPVQSNENGLLPQFGSSWWAGTEESRTSRRTFLHFIGRLRVSLCSKLRTWSSEPVNLQEPGLRNRARSQAPSSSPPASFAHIPLFSSATPLFLPSSSPPPLLTSLPAFLPPCSVPPWLMPATFLPPGLQQQLAACGATHSVRSLRQGRQGCTLHQEEWGAPTDH